MKKSIAAALVIASVLVAPYEVDAKSRSFSRSSSSFTKTRSVPSYSKPATTTVRNAPQSSPSIVAPLLIGAAAGYALSNHWDGTPAAQPVRFANSTGAAGTGSIMEAEKEQIPEGKIRDPIFDFIKFASAFIAICLVIGIPMVMYLDGKFSKNTL